MKSFERVEHLMASQRTSVAVVVIFALVSVTTLVLAAFGFMNYRTYRERQWRELRNDLGVDADQLAAALVLPAWNFDHDQIDKVLNSTLKAQSIEAIVLDLSGVNTNVQALVKDDQGRVKTVERGLP